MVAFQTRLAAAVGKNPRMVTVVQDSPLYIPRALSLVGAGREEPHRATPGAPRAGAVFQRGCVLRRDRE